MTAAGTRSDYEGLGLLMRRAGVESERVEAMVREFLATRADERIARLQMRELQSLREALGEGLDAMRADQDCALKAMSLALSTFRREANVYQRAFATATRRTCALAAVAILLQLVAIGIGLWLLVSSRPAAREPAPASLNADERAYAGSSLRFADVGYRRGDRLQVPRR